METPDPGIPVQNQDQKDIIILVIILILICCISIGISAGGYYIYEQYTEAQAISQTATSEYMATKIKQDTQAQATLQAQGTATAKAFQAQITATAQAKNADLMGYKNFDPFNSNVNDWRTDDEDNDYWSGATSIQNGVYTWQVDEVKETFVAWSDFDQTQILKDFDAAVLARRQSGKSNVYCYGFLFRKSPDGFDSGSYAFSVCENGYFAVNYYDQNGWEEIIVWTETSTIYESDWNLLEVSARGANFTLSINNQQVAQFSDERLEEGLLAVLIDIYEQEPGRIEFDNFALQPR